VGKLTFHSGLPDHRGLMGNRRFNDEAAVKEDAAIKYTLIIRGKDDPERPSTLGALAWRKKVKTGTPEEWARRIIQHLADGVPRTFNRIMVEISGVTADIAFHHPPEDGLWLAVERGYLGWTSEAPILFKLIRPAGFRKRRGMAMPKATPGSLGTVEMTRAPLPLEGKFTAFDVSRKLRIHWFSLGGFPSLAAAKDTANAWTVGTGHGVAVMDRQEKLAYKTLFTENMAKLFTEGWKEGTAIEHLGEHRHGTFHYVIPDDEPAKGYLAVVSWDGEGKKASYVPLTSVTPSKKRRAAPETPSIGTPEKTDAPRAPRRQVPRAPREPRAPRASRHNVITAAELIRQALERYK